FVPRGGKVLIVINGAYGRRIAQICRVIGRAFATLETPEDTPPDPRAVAAALASDAAITHVAVVYCETTSGILNPVPEIAGVVAAHAAQGGTEGGGARYRGNCRVLVEGMREMGFRTLLPDSLQAPIIVTFLTPADPRFDFAVFYEALRRQGYLIYPGKLTIAD